MTDSINGTTVYVCEYHYPPTSGHYGDTGKWACVGVLANENDAKGWALDNEDKRYYARTVGIVEAPGE
jgi:hypothetical protein